MQHLPYDIIHEIFIYLDDVWFLPWDRNSRSVWSSIRFRAERLYHAKDTIQLLNSFDWSVFPIYETVTYFTHFAYDDDFRVVKFVDMLELAYQRNRKDLVQLIIDNVLMEFLYPSILRHEGPESLLSLVHSRLTYLQEDWEEGLVYVSRGERTWTKRDIDALMDKRYRQGFKDVLFWIFVWCRDGRLDFSKLPKCNSSKSFSIDSMKVVVEEVDPVKFLALKLQPALLEWY